MTHISDILDEADLAREIAAGNVSEREHAQFPELVVLNYTDTCAFDRHWTDVTRRTRGLIYNRATGEVVARAYDKFFNYGEPNAPEIDLDAQVRVLDKLDGSLGIIYENPNGDLAVATRGSFHSEQAEWATEWLRKQHENVHRALKTLMSAELTPVVEIIYQENRIVVQYETEGLIALGAVHRETGAVSRWDLPAIPAAEFFGDMTFREALEREPRPNAEGLVICAGVTSDTFVKLKQSDYISLHRIVSNLTEKEVWRQLRDGTYEDYVKQLPDEFYEWAKNVAEGLKEEARQYEDQAMEYFYMIPNGSRKEEALWIKDNVPAPYTGMMFSLLDKKSLEPAITRLVEPRGA